MMAPMPSAIRLNGPSVFLSACPASLIALVLLVYKTKTSLPGLLIVLTGIPVYFAWRRKSS